VFAVSQRRRYFAIFGQQTISLRGIGGGTAMDTGTEGQASGTDKKLATLAAINRATDTKRQGYLCKKRL
jgi:hypothetical protein